MTDDLIHLIAAIAILAAGVCLVIFAHAYVDPSYILGTVFTLVGTLLGYKLGAVANSSSTLPAAPPQVIVSPPAAQPPVSQRSSVPVTNVELPVVGVTPPPVAG